MTEDTKKFWRALVGLFDGVIRLAGWALVAVLYFQGEYDKAIITILCLIYLKFMDMVKGMEGK